MSASRDQTIKCTLDSIKNFEHVNYVTFTADCNLDAKMIFWQKATMKLHSQLEQTSTTTTARDYTQIVIQGYLNIKTFKDALQLLQHIQQWPNEKIRLYVTRFSNCQEVSHGLRPANQDDPWVIRRFINSLNSDCVAVEPGWPSAHQLGSSLQPRDQILSPRRDQGSQLSQLLNKSVTHNTDQKGWKGWRGCPCVRSWHRGGTVDLTK